jgi:hypothetical protein
MRDDLGHASPCLLRTFVKSGAGAIVRSEDSKERAIVKDGRVSQAEAPKPKRTPPVAAIRACAVAVAEKGGADAFGIGA